MEQPVIVIGLGEMGGVFARGALKSGHPVFPAVRGEDLEDLAAQIPDPKAVIVAVGEKDFAPVMKTLPYSWAGRVILLQNELLPSHWDEFDLENPTVISVWFEKKPGQAVKVIIASPVLGPLATWLQMILEAIDIPVRILSDEDDLLFELVRKNLYILTVNIAGLETDGTVGELWRDHRDLAEGVADDVLELQFHQIGKQLNREKLIEAMVQAFNGDPDHKCKGRSAQARLQRAIDFADEAGFEVNNLRAVAKTHLVTAS